MSIILLLYTYFFYENLPIFLYFYYFVPITTFKRNQQSHPFQNGPLHFKLGSSLIFLPWSVLLMGFFFFTNYFNLQSSVFFPHTSHSIPYLSFGHTNVAPISPYIPKHLVRLFKPEYNTHYAWTIFYDSYPIVLDST